MQRTSYVTNTAALLGMFSRDLIIGVVIVGHVYVIPVISLLLDNISYSLGVNYLTTFFSLMLFNV